MHQHLQKTQPAHFSDEAELLVITDGQMTLELNRRPINLSAGEIIQLMPYQMQQLKLSDNQSVDLFRIRLSLGLLLLSSSIQKPLKPQIDSTQLCGSTRLNRLF